MENTKALIRQFFEKGNWKYEYIEESNMFVSQIQMNNVLGLLKILIFIQEDSYVVSVILNSTVEKEHYEKVSEYLHRANFRLSNGNFEFDYNDGEIRYKTYVDCEDSQPSLGVVENSIIVPIFMFEKYGKNLFRLMLGEGEPQELIEEVENTSIVEDDT